MILYLYIIIKLKSMATVKILNEEFKITNENELILLLININRHWWKSKNLIIWNLITELGVDLENIIISNNWLINVLKRLDEKRSLLVLNKISDTLAKVIENSENFWELLAKFSSNTWYKTQIIRNLRWKGLKFLIRNAKDFQNTVEWLYSGAEDEVFKLLEDDFIKSLFSSAKSIWNTYYYLTNKNKEIFTQILWIDNIVSNIFTYEDLSKCCKWMLNKDFIKILEFMWKEKILEKFYFEKDFYEFLLSLPQSKEKVFLEFLKNN